jgi:hypothetical protein
MSYDLASEGLFFKMGVLDFCWWNCVHIVLVGRMAGAMFLVKEKTKSNPHVLLMYY